MKNIKKNLCFALRDREYGMKNNYRAALIILRDLISDRKNGFTPFWQKSSKNYFFVEQFHVFTNNMKKCYSASTALTPVLLYNIEEEISKFGPIEECITSRGPVEGMLASNQFSMYAVTKKNYLLHLNVETGEIIQALQLSNEYRFKWINWDVLEERFYISSTKSKDQGSPMMALQIFSVWPFTYHGLYEICPSVLGDKISDVMLSNYMLTVSYTNFYVKFFSFPFSDISSSATPLLYNVSSEEMKSLKDLSLKIKLKNNPQVLMEIFAPQTSLSIGGIPWHYITSHKLCHHLWEIRSLENNVKCHEGFIGTDKPKLEPDRCFFHPDESGKIVVQGSECITVYRINTYNTEGGSVDFKLLELYKVNANKQVSETSIVNRTSSGRVVRPIIRDGSLQGNMYNLIQCLSFEDELDAMIVTTIEQDTVLGDWHGIVHIHDNQTGKLMASYKMPEIWNLDQLHDVQMDRDTIYHFTWDHAKHILYIHRLKVDLLY